MNLSDDMKRVVREQRLGFVATVTPDGHHNDLHRELRPRSFRQ